MVDFEEKKPDCALNWGYNKKIKNKTDINNKICLKFIFLFLKKKNIIIELIIIIKIKFGIK
jgi:hypothetical protein